MGVNIEDLLFLHGFSQNATYFADQAAIFEQDFRVHHLDLIGHGQKSDEHQIISIKGSEKVIVRKSGGYPAWETPIATSQ